jgi:hypothetical protein
MISSPRRSMTSLESGAGTATGSRHLPTPRATILLDCGLLAGHEPIEL